MNLLNTLQSLNENLNIISILDDKFKSYGSILNGDVFSELIQFSLKNIQTPSSGNSYTPSFPDFYKFKAIQDVKSKVYGGLPIQAGFVSGHNLSLTGFEYHQGSETIIAVTDLVLILGKRQDLVDDLYSSEKVEVFFVHAGQAVELYGTTLHYTPCKTSQDPFLAIVILHDGTNFPLNDDEKQKTLIKKNKWFITHASESEKIKNGAFPGLLGELITINIWC